MNTYMIEKMADLCHMASVEKVLRRTTFILVPIRRKQKAVGKDRDSPTTTVLFGV